MAALACPLCLSTEGRNVRTEVYDTRRDAAANAVIRRRRCPECRAQVSTVEQVAAVRPAATPVPRLMVSAAGG